MAFPRPQQIERPSVIAPRPTGVAATDTANLQAALNAVASGGTVALTGTQVTGPYLINATLTVPVACDIYGTGVHENWLAGSSVDYPGGTPPIIGCVLKVVAPDIDGIRPAATQLSVNLRRFGILFDSSLASTGHGFNWTTPIATQVGGVGLTWEDLICFGHDKNHYGFVFNNVLHQNTLRLRSFGGGGFLSSCNAPSLNTGNAVHVAPFAYVAAGAPSSPGTAVAYGHLSTASSGNGGLLNLITYIRPQGITYSGGPRLWDDTLGAGAPDRIVGVNMDLESPNPSYAKGVNTEWIGKGLVGGAAANVAYGRGALSTWPAGGNNTAVGENSLRDNGIGNNNTAIGANALLVAVSGTSNTAVGSEALMASAGATNNTAVGRGAMKAATSGANSVAVGTNALTAVINGGSNTAVGFEALKANTAASSCVAVGYQALLATTGNANTAIGRSAMAAHTTGTNNVAVGTDANSAGTSFNHSTALGNASVASATSATAVGSTASATATGSVAIGRDSTGVGASSTVSDVIALGTALHVVQISNNSTGAGTAALGANCPATTTTAPYTWLKMRSSDGSVVYAPVWK